MRTFPIAAHGSVIVGASHAAVVLIPIYITVTSHLLRIEQLFDCDCVALVVGCMANHQSTMLQSNIADVSNDGTRIPSGISFTTHYHIWPCALQT